MKTRTSIFALATLLALALPLRAQDLAGAADKLTAQIKAAQKPKSDKWKLSLLPVGLQKNPQINYTIMTEMTEAGRKLPTPSINKPVYYIPHSVGQHDVGDAYGGTKEIQYKALEKQLFTSLASNGYLPTDPAHPENQPTQLLIIAWGMHNRIEPLPDDSSSDDSSSTDDGSGDTTDMSTDTSSMGSDVSMSASNDDLLLLLSRAKVIGGQKFADEFATALADQLQWSGNTDYESNGPLRRFATRDDNTETLVYEIFNDCYYVIVTALDIDALKNNEKKTLWTTHISTTSQGVSFEQTLPIMISNAAWYFGRPTDTPEIIRRKAYRDGRVDIGDLQVVGFETGSTAATGTAAPAAKSATKPSTTTTGTNKK